MVYSKFVSFCLGFGSGIFVMSLIKRLFKRKGTKRSNLNETAMSIKGLLDSPQRELDESVDEHSKVTKSSSSSSTNSDSSVNQRFRQTRRKLNSTLRKYSRTEKKLHRKKCEILQMENEIVNLTKSIKNNELQMDSLNADFNNKKLQILEITSFITPESETEIKKREVLCYKRYTNIKTATDAKAVMKMIRQRQAALKTLEILTFKKWTVVQKELKIGNSNEFRLQNWFKNLKNNNSTSESNPEFLSSSQEEDDNFVNPFSVCVFESDV